MAEPVTVQCFAAKPNPLWPEEIRQATFFLRYSQAVPCQECGTRSRYHWTLACSLHAHTFPNEGCVVQESATVHLPLQPVCRAHLLALADWPRPPSGGRTRAATPLQETA